MSYYLTALEVKQLKGALVGLRSKVHFGGFLERISFQLQIAACCPQFTDIPL